MPSDPSVPRPVGRPPAAPGAPVADPVRLVLPGPFRAAVFDMDGLLLDTEPLWTEAERTFLRRHGHELGADDAAASHGRGVGASARIYAERIGGIRPAEVEAAILDLMRAAYAAGPAPRPGARDLVAALAGRFPIAVASSTHGDLVRLALRGAGLLAAFPVVASGADLGRPKPDPAAFLEACRLLGVEPSSAVAFEDSPVGVRAAVAAGCHVVGVPDRPGVASLLRAAGAHRVVASLAEVALDLR